MGFFEQDQGPAVILNTSLAKPGQGVELALGVQQSGMAAFLCLPVGVIKPVLCSCCEQQS